MCGRCSGKNGGAGYGVDSLIIPSIKSVVSCISCVVKGAAVWRLIFPIILVN